MPGDIYSHLADLAMVFHWSPSELWRLPLDELARWHHEANRRHERE